MWVPRQPHRLLPTSPRYLRLHTDSRSCRVPAIGGAFSSLAARFSFSRTRLETNDRPSWTARIADDMSGRRKKGIVKRITLGKVGARDSKRRCSAHLCRAGVAGGLARGCVRQRYIKVPTNELSVRCSVPVFRRQMCTRKMTSRYRDVCASTEAAPALSFRSQQLEPFCVFRTHASRPLDSNALCLLGFWCFSMPFYKSILRVGIIYACLSFIHI